MFVCIFLLFGLSMFLCVPPPTQYIFHTPMTRYSLYVLKVSLNTNKTNTVCDVSVQVPWIAVDPLDPDTVRYPQYVNARPLEVTVGPGDVLYLPSLWYHHVRQTHACIAGLCNHFCLSVCLATFLSLCLSLCLNLSLSLPQSVSRSVCMSLSPCLCVSPGAYTGGAWDLAPNGCMIVQN